MYMDDIKLFAKNEKEVETLMYSVRIYSQGIGMESGIEKCARLGMKSGKRHLTDRIELLNQDKIRTLREKKAHKYLGILEVDTIKKVGMKEKKTISTGWLLGLSCWQSGAHLPIVTPGPVALVPRW